MRRIQLDSIDGLRALLALYIVAHHVVQFLRTVPPALTIFGYGQAVVAMFLTVSGFCLALPQATSGRWTIDTGTFLRRRARRILPPYYATVVLAIAVCWGFERLGPFRDPVGEFSFAAVWTHLLLVQNWVIQQIYTLDGPLWSIAVECQIYLFFPLLVLLRRRWNWYGMLAVATVLSLAALHLFHDAGQLHFLFFFVLGVLSAEVAFRTRRRWVSLGAIALAAAVFAALPHPTTPQQEACASLACAGLLAYLAQAQGSPLRRALGCRPLAWIGTFSYSIYLLHDLFLAIAWYWIRDRVPAFASRFTLQFFLFWSAVVAASLVVTYGFHVVFERPFMSGKRQRAEQRLAVV